MTARSPLTDSLMDDGKVALRYAVSRTWVASTILIWLAASIFAAFTVVVPLIGCLLIVRAIILVTTQEVVLGEHDLTLRRGMFTTHEQTLPLVSINAISTSIGPLGDWLDYGTIRFGVGNDRDQITVENIAECADLKRRVRERAAAHGRQV